MIVFSSSVIIFYSSHTRFHRNIIIAGGLYNSHYYDDILEYNPDEDSMVVVGHLTQARAYHAVSVVQAQDYTKWCQ